MEIRLLTTEDAEIYLKVCMEGLTKNPEAFTLLMKMFLNMKTLSLLWQSD